MFRAGAGALILTAKPEEINLTIEDARASGRAHDVIVFDERQSYNPIDHELARGGIKGLGNVTEFAVHALEIGDKAMGTSTQSPEPFWAQSDRVEIGNATPLIFAAWGTVSIDSIVDFVNSAAARREEYSDPKFHERSFAGGCPRAC